MIILIRDGETNFKEYWMVDPLDKLKDIARTGVWKWRSREGKVDLSGQDDPWAVPFPRAELVLVATGFSFKVDISLKWLELHCVKFDFVRRHMTISVSCLLIRACTEIR